MRFKTPYNSSEFPPVLEKNTMPSKTIPDQVMSLKEILQRFASGLPVDGGKVPMYYGEEFEMPNIDKMDLAERHEWIAQNREAILQMQRELQRGNTDIKPEPVTNVDTKPEPPKADHQPPGQGDPSPKS